MPGSFHVCLLEGVIEDQHVSKLIRSRQGNQSVKRPLMSHIVPNLDQFGREPCVSPTSLATLGSLALNLRARRCQCDSRTDEMLVTGVGPGSWVLGVSDSRTMFFHHGFPPWFFTMFKMLADSEPKPVLTT